MKEALFVGELNPYGGAEAYALYPFPEHSAGGRLCRVILGLRPGEYLKRFDRANLCAGKWSMPEARKRAADLGLQYSRRPIVLLGAKVAAAFGESFEPFAYRCNMDGLTVILPHPSGRNRLWNEPGAVERAWLALARAGIHVGDTAAEIIAAMGVLAERGDLVLCDHPNHNEDAGCGNPECWKYREGAR